MPENACALCLEDCEHLGNAMACPAVAALALEDLAPEEA
jgi:hypothetical protein